LKRTAGPRGLPTLVLVSDAQHTGAAPAP